MKVYVVSYGWLSDKGGVRPMTPKGFYNDRLSVTQVIDKGDLFIHD